MSKDMLFVPDRFDMLIRRAQNDLSGIIYPVQDSLDYFSHVYANMTASGRGEFIVFKGTPGSGKSTFLHTLPIFVNDAEVLSIEPGMDIGAALAGSTSTQKSLRIVIVEGREALGETSSQEIEKSIHSINQFVRSMSGERTVVVWPANTDDLSSMLERSARTVGGDSLLGIYNKAYQFVGPPKANFIEIANRTISLLNQGASLDDLGVSSEVAESLTLQSNTIGQFLGLIRQELLKNENHVQQLLQNEQCKLWISVIAGNDPDGDIAALTRGANAAIDIDRLMSATNANIVSSLKKYPSQLGILGTVLDAKILHTPTLTALSVARDFSDSHLQGLMQEHGLSIKPSHDALEKLGSSEVAKMLSGQSLGIRSRGAKTGPNSVSAFEKLTNIASKDDAAINRAFGDSLVAGGYILSHRVELPFAGNISIRTDLACQSRFQGIVRLEMMWRKRTSRAEIANYVLGKLYNYGRGIGLLD